MANIELDVDERKYYIVEPETEMCHFSNSGIALQRARRLAALHHDSYVVYEAIARVRPVPCEVEMIPMRQIKVDPDDQNRYQLKEPTSPEELIALWSKIKGE